jgi:hypothetical protein
VGIAQERLPAPLLEQVIAIMQDKRRDFAALDIRFPVPSVSDVRAAALTVDMLARVGCLRSEQLPSVLAVLAAIEEDVEQELGAAYPVLTTTTEFQGYQAAVDGLQTALRNGMEVETILTRQSQVSEAARQIAEIVIQPPVADPGPPSTIHASGGEAIVTLDASAFEGFGGRQIAHYYWDRR